MYGMTARVAAGVVVCTSFALAGPDWIEIGDAGGMVNTGQRTFGTGPLNTIAGSLSTGFGMGDYEDMFLISVTDPSQFSLTLLNATFDAQLFMFNVTLPGEAFGLLANQGTIDSNVPVLGPMSTDGSGAQLTMPGIYAIAITGMGRTPISITGEIFNFASPTEISGADGPGGLNPHSGWTGIGETGSYLISLQGAGFSDIPGPGALAVMALGALAGSRRRRNG